ncbi:MAG TPA: Sec-independent protein translocase protein TatB [Rhizomicrobium sp.]|nr:Sec-independent protein translocase protein TatB [Rhizomicrobium sp.]
MFFDLSWSHIFLVLIVALVVVGPKDLPKMMRMVGRWTGKAREMANQLRKSFDEMARQSELDELRAEIEALRSQQPLADIDRQLRQPILPDEMLARPIGAESPRETPALESATPETAAPEKQP